MKTIWKDMLTALFLGLILPSILLNLTVLLLENRSAMPPVPEIVLRETVPETTAETVPETTQPPAAPVTLLLGDGTGVEMDMEEYLVCAVLGEMPASFELEALKAQSVAARTYAKKVAAWGTKHGENTLCTDSACCQAYISQENYLNRGGTPEDLEKIRAAVAATAGQVLTYEGELIEAVYFSCSGGSTEEALDVWGGDIPYLQSVESPGEEEAPHDTDTVTFDPESFQTLLGQELPGPPQEWFGEVSYTTGGGVDTMTIGGISYSGTALRTQLGLRSTAFTVEATDTAIAITTRGWGHRVGMSQYGADAMAVLGSAYGEILAHYYPGTELTQGA